MARYSVKTKLYPEEAIEKAKAYFGEGGLGLEMSEQNPCCVYFEGGGGHVTVTAGAVERKERNDGDTGDSRVGLLS